MKIRLLMPLMSAVLLLLACQSLQAAAERFEVPIADSPQIGPEDAPVTVVEFLDYT